MLVAVLAISGFSQADLLEKPTANLTERWTTNSSGWQANDALCGWTNGALAIKSPLQSVGSGMPRPPLSLIAQSNASWGIFLGNYAKIDAVSFDVQPLDLTWTNIPTFYIKSAVTGRVWSFPFLHNAENGKTVNVSIPMIYSTNWVSGYMGIDPDVKFNIDKTNICEVGFELVLGPNDLSAQQFTVDNMKLVGAWTGPFSNDVPLAWVMEMGITNDFATAGLADSDGDTFINAAEFLAGTDPTNANSFFKIEIVRNSDGKMAVRWAGNNNANYALQEANALGSNTVFTTRTNISPAAIQTQEVAVDQNDSNSKFFKVSITPKN